MDLIKTKAELDEFLAKNADCKVIIHTEGYEIVKSVVKEVKKVEIKKSKEDILKEIDTDGNGHITKKEVKDWSEKEDK